MRVADPRARAVATPAPTRQSPSTSPPNVVRPASTVVRAASQAPSISTQAPLNATKVPPVAVLEPGLAGSSRTDMLQLFGDGGCPANVYRDLCSALECAAGSHSAADAKAAIACLDVFAGYVGLNAAQKAVRRHLDFLANAPVPRRAQLAKLDAATVFESGPRDYRVDWSGVSPPKAFVDGDHLGDFLNKGAHLHVRIDGLDVEVGVSAERGGGVRYEMIHTRSATQLSPAAQNKAKALVASRLGHDPEFRHRLRDALSSALAVPGAHESSVLAGASQLLRLLKRC